MTAMNNQIYMNSKFKYPLNINEYNKLDKAWEMINIFNTPFIFITDYRNYLIKKIRKKYTLNEFFELETIINKLFWNLRWMIFPLFINPEMTKVDYDNFINNNYNNHTELPNSLLLCKKIKYENEKDLDDKLKNINCESAMYYRSFINKLIIIDYESKIIYNKEMEGSATIFSKNIFNLYTMTILFNRKLYEKIMNKPFTLKKHKIKLSNYYYQYDYGFPNLNYCVFSVGTNEYKINRIKKIYYNKSNKFEYWYKLI